MNYSLWIAGAALSLSIIVNIFQIAFSQGALKANQEHQEKTVELLREEFKEHFNRLEEKQDKHNNLIERMVVVEQSCKSLHHRLDMFEGVHHE
jgi:hypothetical protein